MFVFVFVFFLVAWAASALLEQSLNRDGGDLERPANGLILHTRTEIIAKLHYRIRILQICQIVISGLGNEKLSPKTR